MSDVLMAVAVRDPRASRGVPRIMRRLLLALACTGCGAAGPVPDAPRPAAAERDAIVLVVNPWFEDNPWRESARAALSAHCGSCHLPGLPTSNLGALGVFDLDRDTWWDTMDADQLVELAVKFREEDGPADTEIAHVDAFVRCAVTGACD